MGKKYESRKFRKLRKSSKNYSTRRNKSGGTLGTWTRSLTSDGRLLEDFKSKIRSVQSFGALLDDPNNTMIEKMRELTRLAANPEVNKGKEFIDLKNFININYPNLTRILDSDTSIKRKEFYNKVIEEVHDTMRFDQAGNSDFSIVPHAAAPAAAAALPAAPPLPPARHVRSLPPLPPTPASLPGMGDDAGAAAGVGDSDADDVIENTTIDGAKVYKITNRRCITDTEEGNPQYFTCDYVTDGQKIPSNARCKFCFKTKAEHIQQSQQGGSRRQRRTMRSRKNKTRRNGKCRACRCPGGCKRSTCPCYRGRSKPCCTKRCRSRGRVCRC